MEDRLRVSWQSAIESTRPGSPAELVFEEVVGHYREPHRRYHTVVHLELVISDAEELLAVLPVRDAAAVRLALFFHDAVYDPRADDNEAQSALLATRLLRDLEVPEARIATVARLVEATADHVTVSGDLDLAVVNDADLAVLGGAPAAYDAYVTGVRAEYAHVDEAAWRTGRALVLRKFLERPAIFASEPMREHEPRARANLAAELSSLRG